MKGEIIMNDNKNLIIENAQLVFRNFSGKAGKYNPAGRRNFCVILDYDTAIQLEKDGWNVRWLDPKEEGDDKKPYMSVAVAFNIRPPHVVLISGQGKSALDEASIDLLDWAELETVDLSIRPYAYDVNDKKGIKAYLKSLYATLAEDEFESKYYDTPDSATSTVGGCGSCGVCDGHCGCHGD